MTATGRGHTIAVFWHNERAYAVDNRCPHMGFPLARGICEDGVLTCYWHYARFDLDSGGAFDIWAGDVRTYPVTVRDNAVYVDLRETQSVDERYAQELPRSGEGPGARHCAQSSQGRAGHGRPEASGRERSRLSLPLPITVCGGVRGVIRGVGVTVLPSSRPWQTCSRSSLRKIGRFPSTTVRAA